MLFWGHDGVGADMARDVLRRLRASTALADYLAALARHHLRLGFLVHERPLSRRHVYRYLRACEPVELEVTLLSVADRLATRGQRTRTGGDRRHLELARELAAEALAWRAAPARAAGARRRADRGAGPRAGPEVGRLLELLRGGGVRGRGAHARRGAGRWRGTRPLAEPALVEPPDDRPRTAARASANVS